MKNVKIMDKKHILSWHYFFITLAFSTPGYTQTLQDAVQQTIDKNPEILSASSERLAVEEEISQARGRIFSHC